MCEGALCCFGFGIVVYGDFFAVAFVDVHVWRVILKQVHMRGCGDDCFALSAGLFLQVES